MFTKLAAENILKTTLKGLISTSMNKKFLAYSDQKLIKVKSLHTNAPEIEIPIKKPQFTFRLSEQ